MPSAPEPKKILQALLADSPEPLPFPPEQLDRARALARAEADPSPADVEALPEPLALALLELAVRRKGLALPEALAASSNKALAKAGKKALYQLRSVGVAVPEKKPAAEPAPAPTPAPAEEFPCLVSPIIGTGERAIIVPRPMKGGGLEVWDALLSDEAGIIRLTKGDIARNAYRRQLKELRGAKPRPAVEASRDEVRELLSDALGTNLRAKTPFPEGLDELVRYLGATPREQPAALPPPEPNDERLATGSQALHNEPEIQPWLPPEAELRRLSAKMDELAASPLQLSSVQRTEQLRDVFRAAAKAFFTPELRRSYAHRLWQMASFYEKTDRPEPAQLARAEARRLYHLAPDSSSAFAEFLFEKVLVLMARGKEGRPMPEPGEPIAEEKPAANPAEKRTPGGLILP